MKIYLKEQEVKIGDIIALAGITCKLTQELIDLNPNHFRTIEEKIKVPKYVECIAEYPCFTVGGVYKFPNPIDDEGDERRILSTWDEIVQSIFKPSTKKAYYGSNRNKKWLYRFC